MAWVKVPAEHHPLFMDALPRAPDVQTMKMFGGIAATVNGNMAAGLFGRSAIVRLSDADQKRALALEGAGPFDPMGNGRVMSQTIMLPEDVMEDPRVLGDWLARAVDHARSLPPKAKKGAATKKAAPAKKRAAAAPKKPAAAPKKSAAKSAPKKRAAKKKPARR
jgi:TfoX/Sxy family transcriptional regulator of competence genes